MENKFYYVGSDGHQLKTYRSIEDYRFYNETEPLLILVDIKTYQACEARLESANAENERLKQELAKLKETNNGR